MILKTCSSDWNYWSMFFMMKFLTRYWRLKLPLVISLMTLRTWTFSPSMKLFLSSLMTWLRNYFYSMKYSLLSACINQLTHSLYTYISSLFTCWFSLVILKLYSPNDLLILASIVKSYYDYNLNFRNMRGGTATLRKSLWATTWLWVNCTWGKVVQ